MDLNFHLNRPYERKLRLIKIYQVLSVQFSLKNMNVKYIAIQNMASAWIHLAERKSVVSTHKSIDKLLFPDKIHLAEYNSVDAQ